MDKLETEFFDFLIAAKRHSYAAGGPPEAVSCRKHSKDLRYSLGDYEYLDSYFGAEAFLGEEVVYRKGIPLWGMNYHGHSIFDADGDADAASATGGMGEILHAALMLPPREAPYRGPRSFKKGTSEYRCSWEGVPTGFFGEEEILCEGKRIYFLRFHGGSLS